MQAKLSMVATDHGDNDKKLKDVLNKDDPVAMAGMAGMTATSKKSSEEDQSLAGNMNPLLLMSARMGSWEALNLLLEREDAKKPPMIIPTTEFLGLLESVGSAQGGAAARDVEEGFDHQPASLAAGALLGGVTPDGDTALHVVSGNGDGQNFLKYAGIIYGRDKGLLLEKNHKGDTPLHCAARGRNSRMVSHLIGLAAREGAHTKLEFLRMENRLHETALHEAVRFEYGRRLRYKEKALIGAAIPAKEEKNKSDEIGSVLNEDGKSPGDADGTPEERNIVKLLMGADTELANYPADGVSPLYLAILLHKSTIGLTLYHMSGGNLSYSGADGQNALHVAVLRDTVMVEFLVHWNRSLSTQVDQDGSTPLHFASSLYIGSDLRFKLLGTAPWFQFERIPSVSKTLNAVFYANPAALYQPDKDGYFPIHVAASVGVKGAIQFFYNEYRDCVGLCDAKGRTFLHVAVDKKSLHIVSYVCQTPSLAWILNMQDNDGKTALHIAIEARNFEMFCALFGSPWVNLDRTNNRGETLRDLSRTKVPSGISYLENPDNKIHHVLGHIGVSTGALRWDKLQERYRGDVKQEDEDKAQSQVLANSAQTLIVAAVLIATVAFTATFALPGGYRADDHINGGTPTHAGSYVFDAFMMATTLAFICSIVATIGFVFAATPMVNLYARQVNSLVSVLLVSSSLTSMSIAFALGVYMVLAPVARSTAVAVCAITPAVLLSVNRDSIFHCVTLARPLCTRIGLFPGIKVLLKMHMQIVVFALWPIIVTFGWAALARIHRHS